ncbi:hypothetical protein BKA65DRAFT_478863 [Rhexocercosporidium sp. MPI-PUGE-AT-0058]|nr:hypothetical protein BKA65DRAFT_478863 [Rhexocercosporidium sp. MPI-PUGE-AT-0058]
MSSRCPINGVTAVYRSPEIIPPPWICIVPPHSDLPTNKKLSAMISPDNSTTGDDGYRRKGSMLSKTPFMIRKVARVTSTLWKVPKWQSVTYYIREFDALGLLLVFVGSAFFLLPLNLYSKQGKAWGSALIICFLVFGGVLLIAFGIWRKLFAPASSILGNSSEIECSVFTSVLQEVDDLSVAHASYVVRMQTVGSVLTALVGGGIMSYTGR